MTTDQVKPVEEVRERARAGGLEVLDREQVQPFLRALEGGRLGRFVRCGQRVLSGVLEGLLGAELRSTERPANLVMVCRNGEGVPVLAIRGQPMQLVELASAVPDLAFAILPPTAAWKIERAGAWHLRVEGGPWTRFFPWPHVWNSLVVGLIVTLITAVAMWLEHGEFWLPAGGYDGLTRRVVEGFWAAIVAPGALAALANFISLTGLGPDQNRSGASLTFLLGICFGAIMFAVVLATIHQPLNSAH